MSAEESLCSRCACSGATCCQKTEIFLTAGDVARIRGAGVREEFWDHVAPTDEECKPDFSYDPVWSRIFDDRGRRRIIRHREDGGCWFLTGRGCSLSLDARPLVCRLYPFDYTPTTIKGVYGHLCPSPEKENPPLLLAALGMNRDEAEQWRRQLYGEIAGEFSAAGGARR
ncbi:MAG: YkgJ family cysteine cluster protein [Planctomycetota bacterium]|jgi:Fe-S-cluster containining protein|nr:YkgJ family cysteine cluster protein [Planctomycetota bacterium]